MNQALHIFRKDVRYLWYPILVILALHTAYTVFAIRELPFQWRGVYQLAGLLSTLLVLGWWYLIALLIHAEPLPGDRQFWLTRPYDHKSLIAAKMLFIAMFMNLPLFLSDCISIGMQGFPVLTNIPLILVRQLPCTLMFILPALILAVITSGLGQYLLAWFVLALALVIELSLAAHNARLVTVNVGHANWVGEWILI